MPNNDINQNHVYETSLLGWVVQEYINGDTDWYSLAGFKHEGDAHSYRDYLAERDPSGNFVVSRIGTLHQA